MAVILADNLIAKFQYAYDNKFGYILGAWHTEWTAAAQNNKVTYMKGKYGADWKNSASAQKDKSYMAAAYGDRWIGHWVTDCSGLFYWAFKELGGYMYHGSNTMWNKYCEAKGTLRAGKRTDGEVLKPGTAVFTCKTGGDRSHVGLFIGNGKVIEASGTKVGVIMTDITNSKWNEWGELKSVAFTHTTPPSDINQANNHTAVVNNTRVALRSGPSTSFPVLTRIDKGTTVEVVDDTWTQITYQGKTGYMMTKFLSFD